MSISNEASPNYVKPVCNVLHHETHPILYFTLPGSCLTQMLQVFFPEGSLEFEIRVSKDPSLDSEPSKRSRSTNFEDSRRILLKHAGMRIETQRKHQLLLRESTKNNEEIGKEIVLELGQVAQQMEIDKVKKRKQDRY